MCNRKNPLETAAGKLRFCTYNVQSKKERGISYLFIAIHLPASAYTEGIFSA